jgi:hypothetical protein
VFDGTNFIVFIFLIVGCIVLKFTILELVAVTTHLPFKRQIEGSRRSVSYICKVVCTVMFMFCDTAAGNVCNWALAIVALLYHLQNFATYLLSIFMANLLLYCMFYIVMKV